MVPGLKSFSSALGLLLLGWSLFWQVDVLAAYENPSYASTGYEHASSHNDRGVDHSFTDLICLVASSADTDLEQPDFYKTSPGYPVDYFLLFEGGRLYTTLQSVNSVFPATPVYLSTERFRL